MKNGLILFLLVLQVMLALACGGGGGGSAASAPVIVQISPAVCTYGDKAFTLEIYGTGFDPGAVVQWGANPRPTTYVSGAHLQAAISADDLKVVGQVQVKVANPPSAGGASLAVTFAVGRPLTNDLTWDSARQVLYLALPAGQSGGIAVFDPRTDQVRTHVPIDGGADLLAFSDDGRFLYVAIQASSSIRRYTLPDLSLDQVIALGADPENGPYTIEDMQVAPGAPRTLAVNLGRSVGSPKGVGGVVVYDDQLRRPFNSMDQTAFGHLMTSIQWSSDATTLYGAETEQCPGIYQLMSVTDQGPTPVWSAPGVFHEFNRAIHFDPGTKRLFCDGGEILDPLTGHQVGLFSWPGLDSYTMAFRMVPDTKLQRAFFLGNSTAGLGFVIHSFDTTTQAPVGALPGGDWSGSYYPTRIVRWGQDGLAHGGGKNPLWTYSGTFVSGAAAPAPTVGNLQPSTVLRGSPACTLDLFGTGFGMDSVVQLNGSPRTTTYLAPTHLQAAIPASDLAVPGAFTVTVQNPAGTGGLSSGQVFTVTDLQARFIPLPSNDIAWDPARKVLYASIPSSAGRGGNSIAVIDPVLGKTSRLVFAGSEPQRLALSGDGQYLYVALDGASAIKRFLLPDLVPDLTINLGSSAFDGPKTVLDMQVAPGAPRTLAVTIGGAEGIYRSDGGSVVIYDDDVPRPLQAKEAEVGVQSFSLQWGANAGVLFTNDCESTRFNLTLFNVTVQGLALVRTKEDAMVDFYDFMHFDGITNRIYTDRGGVLDPETGDDLGRFSVGGRMVPDSAVGRAFFLGEDEVSCIALASMDLGTRAPLQFVFLGGQSPNGMAANRLIRWGANGLASGGGGSMVLIMSGPFVDGN